MDYNPPSSSVRGILHDRNTGVGCHFLLQGIFPTQGLNLGLLHCRQTLYRLSHREDLTTGQTEKSHDSPFFIYMSYSWWPCYVSWYHLFIFRMSFLFEKFLCNWLYKWEPNSRQHTGSHSRKYNLWQNKRHKTKTHSIFCEGPHSNSVAVKLHETRPRICVRLWTPKSSFCYIFFWPSC